MPTPKCLHCAPADAVNRWSREHSNNQVGLDFVALSMGRVVRDLLVVGKLDAVQRVPMLIENFLEGVGLDDVGVSVAAEGGGTSNPLN